MPNTIIHEKVGLYLSKKIGLNSYSYYLGILAPDSVNVDKFGSKKDRWTSHVRKSNLNDWKKNLKRFYLDNKDKVDNDFLKGYVIHILTDIIYDEYFEETIKKEILKDYSIEKYWYIKWEDMDNYTFSDVYKINNILRSKDYGIEILNITDDKLLRWKNKFLNNQKKISKSIYNNEKIIDNLCIRVEEELNKILEEEKCDMEKKNIKSKKKPFTIFDLFGPLVAGINILILLFFMWFNFIAGYRPDFICYFVMGIITLLAVVLIVTSIISVCLLSKKKVTLSKTVKRDKISFAIVGLILGLIVLLLSSSLFAAFDSYGEEVRQCDETIIRDVRGDN